MAKQHCPLDSTYLPPCAITRGKHKNHHHFAVDLLSQWQHVWISLTKVFSDDDDQ